MENVAKAARAINWFKLSRISHSLTGLALNTMIGETMVALIGRDARIEDADIPLAIVAADISTGEKYVFRSGSVANAVMASTCIPGLFAPVSFEGRLLVDGGLVENLPIAELPGMGADITIGVNLERWRSYKRPSHAVGVLLNSMDIMVQHQSIMHGAAASVIIEPHLEKYTSSAWDKADELIAEGVRVAEKALPEIRNLAGSRHPKRRAKTVKATWYVRSWRWFAKRLM
jgi:NTE family protein